jgi:hypothetical protein
MKFWERLQVGNLPYTETFQPGWYDFTDSNSPYMERIYKKSMSFSASGAYFKDARLHSLIGVRLDSAKRKYLAEYEMDEYHGSIFPGNFDEAPECYKYDDQYDLSNSSYTASLNYRIVQGFNVYGGYSNSYNWQRGIIFNGDSIGPIIGSTKEIGIKARLWKRLYLTLAAFDIHRKNALYRWTPDDLEVSDSEALFNPNNLQPGDPGYLTVADGYADEYRSVASKQHSRGWETTLQVLRWQGLQARLAYSYADVTVDRDMSQFRTLYEAAVARDWAAREPGGETSMAEDESLLAIAKRILENNEGKGNRTGASSAPNSVSWIVDYQFPKSSLLKGARVSLFGKWTDNFNARYDGVYYKTGAMHPIGMYVMYNCKVAGLATTFRLGIKNMIDLENTGKYRNSATIARLDENGRPEYQCRYVTPPSVTASITVKF